MSLILSIYLPPLGVSVTTEIDGPTLIPVVLIEDVVADTCDVLIVLLVVMATAEVDEGIDEVDEIDTMQLVALVSAGESDG